MNPHKPITVTVCAIQKKRADVINPLSRVSFRERLVRAGAIDLKNNYIEEISPSGYTQIKALDSTKTLKKFCR
jgi:hypothetical protein